MKACVGASRARFERLHLHELVERIDEFGGPFQTVLLVNAYQHLIFGSERSPVCYPDLAMAYTTQRIFDAASPRPVGITSRRAGASRATPSGRSAYADEGAAGTRWRTRACQRSARVVP